MTWFDAIVLAIVEGITEYLPISSTGHIILASSLFGIKDDPFTKNYTVIVQFGAILAVLVIYFERFKLNKEFYQKLAIAVVPALAIGFLVKNEIDYVLGSVQVVATSLILGGILLLFLEKFFKPKNKNIDQLTYKSAFLIGICQCIAFLPGVSRAAASIMAGMWQGLDRKQSAEFSFFLAVPTLTAASLYKCIKMFSEIGTDGFIFMTLADANPARNIWFMSQVVGFLVVGNIVSFIVGYLAIKSFISYLSKHSFFAFGVYRIAVGIIFWILILVLPEQFG